MKTTREYTLWFEGDHWAPGEWTAHDCNMDVEVQFADGARWGASFFTFDNIDTLRKKYAESGQCLSGAYFWARGMILIDELTRERITEVVDHLIRAEEFESTFEYSDHGEEPV